MVSSGKKVKKEKTKYWGFRALKKHRKMARFHAKKEHVSESEIVRRAIEEYDKQRV